MTAVAGSGVLAIGAPDVILGLGLLGIEGVAVADAFEARTALESALEARRVALVLVDEDYAAEVQDLLRATAKDPSMPLVVEVPSPNGARGSTPLRSRVERTLGLSLDG